MASITSDQGIPLAVERPSRSLWQDALAHLARSKVALAALGIIGFFTLAALFADLLAPHPHDYQSRSGSGGGNSLPPAWVQTGDPATSGRPGYWLGTDRLGRDTLSRVIYAARVSMATGFIPMVGTLAIGVCVGMLAGYRGGWVDNLLMRLVDALYAFPDLLFILVLLSVLRGHPLAALLSGLAVIFVAFALTSWIGVARLVRAQVLALKEKEFIEAARATGTPTWRIMFLHLLPNMLGSLVIYGTFAIPGFIAVEAMLEYLGIGVKPPYPAWGAMVAEGQQNIWNAPHTLWVPAACIGLVTLAFTFLGDRLRDALDPTSQARSGR